jgi:hypothetical protein
MVWDCLIVGLLWLHYIQSLANVTMVTIAFGKVDKLVLPRTSCLLMRTVFRTATNIQNASVLRMLVFLEVLIALLTSVFVCISVDLCSTL